MPCLIIFTNSNAINLEGGGVKPYTPSRKEPFIFDIYKVSFTFVILNAVMPIGPSIITNGPYL
jgi:hypothetical protein